MGLLRVNLFAGIFGHHKLQGMDHVLLGELLQVSVLNLAHEDLYLSTVQVVTRNYLSESSSSGVVDVELRVNVLLVLELAEEKLATLQLFSKQLQGVVFEFKRIH